MPDYVPPTLGTGQPQASMPPNLVEGAKRAVLSGGPNALSDFMRANGHPISGAYCGEFAAAVMQSQGLPFPKNPEIASNWRNIGTPVEPGPNTIAVKNGTPTGQTGSHVTFAENYDPKTGTFTGFGANQNKIEDRYKAKDYTFYPMPSIGGNAAALAGGGLPSTPPPSMGAPPGAAPQTGQRQLPQSIEGTPSPDQPAPPQQPPQGGLLGQPEAPMAPPQQQQGILGQMPQIPFYMRRTNPQLAYSRIPLPPGFQGFQGA